tara:strand:- start:216 stop:413 length:198 start_codon:yes stop_codon:yes gene_type:complete
MPLYEVTVIEKMIYDYTKYVEVEADNEDEAETLALKKAHENDNNWNREHEEMEDREFKVNEIEEY